MGYVLPSTGSLVIIGEPILNGIKMALADIGDSGHLQVRLLPGDSGTDPVIANQAVDDHLAEGVSAIIGAAASGISLSIIDKVAGRRRGPDITVQYVTVPQHLRRRGLVLPHDPP